MLFQKWSKKLKKLQNEAKTRLKDPNLEDEDQRRTLGLIEERIADLEAKRHQKAHTATAAHDRLEGETISKYWSQVNKS